MGPIGCPETSVRNGHCTLRNISEERRSLYLSSFFSLLCILSGGGIVIIIITFMQGIYSYIPETNYVPREYSVATILLLLFMVLISLVPVLNLLYFYISTFRSMCAVPNMAVFWSSLTSCFPDMLLTYFLNDFEIVPVVPIITSIAFVFTFHMRCISIVRSLYFRIFSASYLIIFLSSQIATSINIHVPFSLSRTIIIIIIIIRSSFDHISQVREDSTNHVVGRSVSQLSINWVWW